MYILFFTNVQVQRKHALGERAEVQKDDDDRPEQKYDRTWMISFLIMGDTSLCASPRMMFTTAAIIAISICTFDTTAVSS